MPSEFTQSIVNGQPGFDFVAAHFECEQNLYSATNPQGFVNFGSAQNDLQPAELQQRLASVDYRFSDTHYQPFFGTESCRLAVATYLADISHADKHEQAFVDPDSLVLGNGVISLLEALAVALLDDGDRVLVPTPVFPGLVNALSLRVRSNVAFLPTTSSTDFRLNADMVEAKLKSAAEDGQRIKALLLCSPGNPVGQVYGAEELRAIADVAAGFHCALIVDEIYAGSCYDDASFVSVMTLNRPNVYVLGGLSKDFGLAGFATGWLHLPNEDVRQAVRKQAHFYRLPAPMQAVVEHVIAPSWRRNYLGVHRSALTERYWLADLALKRDDILASPTESGLCLWLDLRSRLRSLDREGEFELYHHLLKRHRVHVSPGSGFYSSEPGYFRMCISHDEQILLEGLARLSDGLASFQPHAELHLVES